MYGRLRLKAVTKIGENVRKLLFLALMPFILAGCPSKLPSIEPISKETPESFKPGSLSPGLAVALDSLLHNPQTSIPADCPEEIGQDISEEQKRLYECGAIKVPEFHDQSSQRSLSLSYLKVSENPSQKKPLLIFEQGGPGSSSMLLADYYLKVAPEILDHFDVLAVEQRGTKWTRPISVCNDIVSYSLETLSDPEGNKEEEKRILQGCLNRVSQEINLDSISTYQIASDLDFAAKHFGYSSYSFYGVSYGTLVGNYMLKYFSGSLEKTILDSPAIPGKDWSHEAFSNMDSLVKKNIESFISDKSSNPKWTKSYQETMDYLNRLSDVFDNSPIELTYTYEDKSYTYQFTGGHFNSILFTALTVHYDPKIINYLIQAAESRSTFAPWSKVILTPLAQAFIDVEQDATMIMYQSLICREFEIDESQIMNIVSGWEEIRKLFDPQEYEELVEGAGETRCYFEFKKREDNLVIWDPIKTNKSVLVVGGELDHVTIPAYVDVVSKDFTNGHKAVFKGVGHGVFGDKECITKTLLGYLTDTQGRFTNFCE